ncbi:hypothetical protein BLNAU_10922 [Blattamonas nauphoetae]|uniref:Uncharacterized protein n=1 Tax=Blattamonas nauphoetae TaxID=2049346 RepID=A0ABQ9XRU2_9EUKA|nr:hypothetical protein BLNAU_10922 [Blattamonas nauphoetae]
MNIDLSSSYPQIDVTMATQKDCLEVFLSQICGDCKTLRPIMLNTLLALATESDWALSTILEVDYIKPLEEYCSKTQPCDVPIALPKLLSLLGKTSEGELDRICGSSIPSSFIEWVDSISNHNMLIEIGNCLLMWTSSLPSYSTFLAHHKTKFLTLFDHCRKPASSLPNSAILAHLFFSPQLEVSNMALRIISDRCRRDFGPIFFLQKHQVPSSSTDSSSKLVPFTDRLCGRLAEHVSEMKSLFAESSPFNASLSALSTTLHEESPPLTVDTVLLFLYDGIYLLKTMFITTNNSCILLKSTIIACLDLLEQQKNESNCPPADRTGRLITLLHFSWNCFADKLCALNKSLHPIVESTFSEVPQLCSLLERTCCHTSRTKLSHLRMIINVGASLPHLISRILKENLVERVMNASKPITIPTSHGDFHLRLVWAINNLILDPRNITKDKEEQKIIRKLQFERGLKPAKQSLLFILLREAFILTPFSSDMDVTTQISNLLSQTLVLERDLFEYGEIVETGREEWEVGWLMEKTKGYDLEKRLKMIREEDVRMKKDEKSRLKKRVERQREAGHEDAMEGLLTRSDLRFRTEINCLKVFLSQICGDCETLRPIMLNTLLALVTESDWALSTILDSSIPNLAILAQLCFSMQLEVSKVALTTLSKRGKSESKTRSFLRTLTVPSGSTDSSSELVPFAGRLCGRLAEHVSQLKSLIAESSPSDGTISAPSVTLPDESPFLNRNTVLEMLCEGVSLLYSILIDTDDPYNDIPIDCDHASLLKSIIITCLDLIEQQKTESNCQPPSRTELLITLLDSSWNCTAYSLNRFRPSLQQVVESAFSDVPQLCSLLERTCRHSSPTQTSHLVMIINISAVLPRFFPHMLEENLAQRVIDESKLMTVPTEHGHFHRYLTWAISYLLKDLKQVTKDKEELTKIQKFQFERVLKPAKPYLQFILQREEFIQTDDSFNRSMSTVGSNLIINTLELERDLFESGEIVETGREEWVVRWLVEKTEENELGSHLLCTRTDDLRMRKNEKERWKRSVKRQREAGHEDALEGWLKRRTNDTLSSIAEYIKRASEESGMNHRIWRGWRYNGYLM